MDSNRPAPSVFCRSDLSVLTLLQGQRTAGNRLGSDKERQQRQDQQRRRMQIDNAISASLDLETILSLVQAAVVQIGDFDRGAVFLYDADAQQMRVVLHTSPLPPHGVRAEYRWKLTLRETTGPLADTARMLCGERPYLLRRNYGESVSDGHSMRAIRDHAEIALRANGRLLGMISLDNLLTGRPITPTAVEALLPFCSQAAAAIYRALLLEERDRARIETERQRALLLEERDRARIETERQRALLEERDRARIETERQARRERLIHAVSRAIGSTHNAEEGIARVLQELRCLGDFLGMGLLRPSSNPALWRFEAVWGAPNALPPVGSTLWLSPERSPCPDSPILHYRPNVARDEGFLSAEIAALGIGSLLHLDLWMEGSCLGRLYLLRTEPDAFSAEERATLISLAPALALALHNADLYRSLKQTQEALGRAETLRAVGELASGIAHNLNNLLAAILGYAELIAIEPEDPDAVRYNAQIVINAALDGAEIVQRVQRFVRRSNEEARQPVQIALLLQEALALTRGKWRDEAIGRGTQIAIIEELMTGLEVNGHPAELREVFINLIRNACDAMPSGGTLTVRCLSANGEVVVEIADTGIGMDAAVQKRVFEPFFTTKSGEQGLGMGLSVSWGLVERHEGCMEVQSAPGQGTLFRVRLPQRASTAAQEQSVSPRPLQARALLVEDELTVREVVAIGLTKAGLTVQAASDSAEALHWLQANDGTADVVIADHGMIGMTGLELLAAVRCSYPHLHRVLLSGWGAHLPGDADISAAEIVLTKPIAITVLVDALRPLLNP